MSTNSELFYERCQKYFGQRSKEFIEQLKLQPSSAFFINEKKSTKEDILAMLDFPYNKSIYNDKSFRYDCDNIGKTKAYELGLIYPQDEESSLVANYIEETEKVKLAIDLCAAPGGKSINVLNRLNDDIHFISNDCNLKRAKILASNLERLGLTNTIITCLEPNYFLKNFAQCFDLVILDAPCSGEGMIRKYPEILDNYNLGNINKLANIQASLLEVAYELLKAGGQLLYSTCTYAFEEDEEQINNFLNLHQDMEIISLPNILNNSSTNPHCLKLSPLNNTEGQFICSMRKKGGECMFPSFKKTVDAKKEVLVNDFIKDNLNVNEYYLYKDRDNYYLSFNKLLNINDGYLTQGIFLGSLINKRFEPSYAMYRSNELKGLFKYVYDLNDDEYLKYISGQELKLDLSLHYYQLTYHNHSLGYGKVSNGILKNKYPKGLRRVL